jgi:hypothetical protein
MGVLSAVLLWPLAPVRGVLSLAEVIQEQVEQELRNPALARRDLEAVEAAYERGDIDAAELARAQQLILDRMRGLPATRPPEEWR